MDTAPAHISKPKPLTRPTSTRPAASQPTVEVASRTLISDRIEAEICRGNIRSPEDEERAQLEHGLDQGVPAAGNRSRRLSDEAEQ